LNSIVKHIAVWSILLLLAGCASRSPADSGRVAHTTALLGVTLAPGVESGRSQSAMALDFEELLQIEGGFSTLRTSEVGRIINAASPGSVDKMLRNYAYSAQFNGTDIRALQNAKLPAQTALVARVEKNVVRSGPTKRIMLHNSAGRALTDRERVVLSTEREMQVRASMVDLANGRVVWSKSYRVAPAAESAYVHYSGSSFSGSLAASFVNTMSNGLKVPDGPVAPSHRQTLRSLFREIVRHLPRR